MAGNVLEIVHRQFTAPVAVLGSGIPAIDRITGIGGYPRGRITELFGTASSGKSALAVTCCLNAAALGLTVVWIDLEHSLTAKLPLDPGPSARDILLLEPQTAEDAVDRAVILLERADIDLLVMDSAIAMNPSRRPEGMPSNMARAEMVGRALRKLTTLVARRHCVMLFLSRSYLMAVPASVASIGGGALRSFASLRLKTTQEQLAMDEGDLSSFAVRVRVVKNKLAPPEREALLYYSLADGTLAEEPPAMVAEEPGEEPWP
ncbi:MAG TPA: ATPase domain-containing protein [Candidatus Cryosericum sp.]